MAPTIVQLIGLILSLLVLIGGVIAAHFMGIEKAKTYTDQKFSELNKRFESYEKKIEDKFESLLEKVNFINDTLIEIKTIVKQTQDK